MKRILSLGFVVLSCILDAGIIAQQHNFKKYSVEKGIQAQVTCLLQDSRGYIWIGTGYGGLNRFDGTTFINYSTEQGLSNNAITSVCEDEKGNLWIGTEVGLNRFDGKTFTIYNVKNGLPDHEIKMIQKDPKGNLWISTGHGLAKFDGSKFTVYLRQDGLLDDKVHRICVDRKGNVWISYRPDKKQKFITRFNGKTFKHIAFPIPENQPTLAVYSMTEDPSGKIWIGTNKYDNNPACLFRIEDDSMREFPFQRMLSRKGFEWNNGVQCLFADSKNNLWVSMADIAFKIPFISTHNPDSSFYHAIENTMVYNGITHGMINCFMEDKNENLWVGTGNGVVVYGGDLFLHYAATEGLKEPVFKIFEDPSGRIWCNGSGGANWYIQENNKFVFIRDFFKAPDPSVRPTQSFIGNDGVFWLGTMQHGLVKYDGFKSFIYDTRNKLPAVNGKCARIIPGYEDNEGNIWCVVIDDKSARVYKLNAKNDKPVFTPLSLPGDISDFPINVMFIDSHGRMWFNEVVNGLCYLENDSLVYITEKDGVDHRKINWIFEDKNGNIWFETWLHQGVMQYAHGKFKPYKAHNGFTDQTVLSYLIDSKGNLWFGTSGDGIFVYDGSTFHHITKKQGLSSMTIWNFVEDNNGNIWCGTANGLNKIAWTRKNTTSAIQFYGYHEGYIGIEGNQNSAFKDSHGNLWFGTMEGVTKLIPANETQSYSANPLNFTGLKLFFNPVKWSDFQCETETWSGMPHNLVLPYDQNHLTFSFIGIDLRSPDKVKYRFILDGFEKKWSPPVDKHEITYSSLPPGTYTFKVKSCNASGIWNKQPLSFTFTITPPWWQTYWFYALCGIVLIASAYSYVKWREKKLQAEKRVLESRVEQRTAQLHEKNEKLEEAYKHITDSIHYAKKIQQAILPPHDIISSALPQHFILYLPKDVVSGDFYTFYKREEEIIVVTADCTGHGVPGAFMSMIGIEQLGKIIIEQGVTQPGEILDRLHSGIRKALKQDVPGGESRDGMDVALCRYHLKDKKIEYAGANRPLWLLRNNTFIETRANKFPIGGLDLDNRTAFTNHEIPLQSGDLVYTFTDGFGDQFGGPKGKKFMLRNLERELLSIAHLTMQEQAQHLHNAFEEWKGNHEQVDDVLVIGVRIS